MQKERVFRIGGIFCFLLFEGTSTSFFTADKKSKRSHKTVGIKVFLLFFLDDRRIFGAGSGSRPKTYESDGSGSSGSGSGSATLLLTHCYPNTGVTAALELALVSKDLTNMEKLDFVRRKVEFMQEFGDVGRSVIC
jgi:hypothetical protein